VSLSLARRARVTLGKIKKESIMVTPPSIDKQLFILSTAAENTGIPCGITLFVHGVVVSGTLSSWRLHYQAMSDVAESATMPEIEFVQNAIQPRKTTDHEGGVPADGSEDVWMQNVTVFLPNGQTTSFEWWQCRLYAVDALSLGLVT
jgi:hypothetical protein